MIWLAGLLWLCLALTLAWMISYTGGQQRHIRRGFFFLFFSFAGGIFLLIYAVSNLA